mmetsp:Transcript_129415/g.238006  ORF Transcript_129415/g.238006 Transcript_129415/m.238006 type:complete len:108 (-) Transcript_129415:1291-1614(-)
MPPPNSLKQYQRKFMNKSDFQKELTSAVGYPGSGVTNAFDSRSLESTMKLDSKLTPRVTAGLIEAPETPPMQTPATATQDPIASAKKKFCLVDLLWGGSTVATQSTT